MSIPTTSKRQLANHIESLGVSLGDDVVVHSRLISFGLLEDGCEGAFEALRAVIGGSGTLVFPTYRLHAGPEEVYDRYLSPSERCGQLSEYVRQLPGACRSRCPIHSHVAVGSKAALLEKPTGLNSLGSESDFDFLHKAGFKQLFLGVDFAEAATFVAHVCSVVGNIPYREWIGLSRKILRADGKIVDVVVRYYARRDRNGSKEDWTVAQQLLQEADCLRTEKAHFGRSYSFLLDDLFQILSTQLKKYPLALLAGAEVSQ